MTTPTIAWLPSPEQAMADTDIYDVRQVADPGAPDQMEAYGWLERTARWVS